jgi:competence protein ComEC
MTGRRYRWLKQSILILSIWAFAFLTGLSTSMVRAAIMLSIFSLFAAGGRQRASLNLLALTLIIMLLYDSSQLYDVGFQLSFSAVFAILIITPIFERFVSKKYLMEHPLQRWLWGLLTVSLAAQIGVAPLIAHYFGHFSTYFLLTNLFVLPITTVILYGALAFLLTSWIFIGKALLWLVSILGQGLTLIAGLPCASIDGLHPSVMQTCMVYLVIVCILIAILTILPPKNTKRKFA